MSDQEQRAGIIRLLDVQPDTRVLHAIHDPLDKAAKDEQLREALAVRAANAEKEIVAGTWYSVHDVIKHIQEDLRG